jgi:outer membrane protein OmpA-like peptidoglycan-associated protein
MLRPASGDSGIDRKTLAGLLLDLAHNVKPDLCTQPTDVDPIDPRLEQLRRLLLGQEIEVLSRLSRVIENPEQLARAVGRVLPTAIGQASIEPEFGRALAPAVEKAAQSSIRNDPRALLNILYPLVLPAIRKSIGETIDETFQSLNETLKHSLTLRGLRWRWEAWKTGSSFAEVVLRHTLVYQVEHVFLIHRHTGLLISHVAAVNATTQDPQLVSSMLVAIQDFVRDSFGGAEHQQGLDTLRLGEFRLWCEPGPFATLAAVIRGNPPEKLHETLGSVLSRIHDEHSQALERFDGDSTGFADIEAQLSACVRLSQQAPARTSRGFPWLVSVVALVLVLLAGAWQFRRWQNERLWQSYVAHLRAEPGIVVTEDGSHDGKFLIAGLRDPLAADPQQLLSKAGIDPAGVVVRFLPYEGLDPQIVLKRLQASLDPPASVTFTIEGDRIVAQGSAPSSWLERAQITGRMLPAGAPRLDLSEVGDVNGEDKRRWEDYVAKLRAEPGIAVTDQGWRDGKFLISGLRDPLAVDPQQLLSEAGIDPTRVVARWTPYQGLDPQIVLKRLRASLDPPSGVTFSIEGERILVQGSAPSPWLERARTADRMLPAGAPHLDLSGVRIINNVALDRLREAIQSRSIRFNENEPLPSPGQDAIIDQLAGELNALASLSTTMHVITRVTVTGHSDAVGPRTLNLSLSLARAEAVRALLKKRGVDPDLLSVRGAGQLEPLEAEASDSARSANRRVSFTVGIEGEP